MDIWLTLVIILGFVVLMAIITLLINSRIARWGAYEKDHLKAHGKPAELNAETFGKDEIGDLMRSYKGMENTLAKQKQSLEQFPAELHQESFGKDEIGDLVKSFTGMESALTRQMHSIEKMTADRERSRAELGVATRIQADMLPTNFPKRDDLSLYAAMTPAKEVGGDFYDFFMIDDDHIALVMADVSGKGVPAALFMVITKTLIKNRAPMGGTPAEILEDVNDQLCESNTANLFVTVWLSILELSTGVMNVCNAGHEYPAIRHSGGGFSLVRSENLPPLATMEGMTYENSQITMQHGDELFLYTDGVPEAKNNAGERFGTDKMIAILDRDKDLSPEIQLKNMQKEIDTFAGTGDPFDDVTMLGFVWR